MGKEKILILMRGIWSESTDYWLAGAVGELAEVRAQVQNGAALLFALYCDGAECGALVLRVDHGHLGDEGVIVAAGGRVPGVSLMRALLPVIEEKFTTADRIRIHTRRRGMVRQLARFGYAVQEIVLSKPAPCAAAAPFVPIPQQCQQQQGGGGGSSSSSESATSNIDKRLVVDTGTGVSADHSTVSVSVIDGGAVEKSLNFGGAALGAAYAFGADSLAGAGVYGQQALESGAALGRQSLALAEKSAKFGIDLSTLTVDRVLDIADTVFSGAFGTIDKNAELIERAGGFVDKAYADAKGSGAERYYLALGVIGAVVIVAVYANKK